MQQSKNKHHNQLEGDRVPPKAYEQSVLKDGRMSHKEASLENIPARGPPGWICLFLMLRTYTWLLAGLFKSCVKLPQTLNQHVLNSEAQTNIQSIGKYQSRQS